jgi:hypothetical protein
VLGRMTALVVTVLLLGCAGSRHDQAGVLSGIVLSDSTGAPISRATLWIVRTDREELVDNDDWVIWNGSHWLATGMDGRFTWPDVAPGWYMMRVRMDGYWHKTVRAFVPASASSDIEVRLKQKRSSRSTDAAATAGG